jgi:hypothetical protein
VIAGSRVNRAAQVFEFRPGPCGRYVAKFSNQGMCAQPRHVCPHLPSQPLDLAIPQPKARFGAYVVTSIQDVTTIAPSQINTCK